jgi:Polysaccharide lyase 14
MARPHARLSPRFLRTAVLLPVLVTMAACRGATSPAAAGGRPSNAGGGSTPGVVADLAVTSVTDSSATLRFTQVGDGAGGAAHYQLRMAPSPIAWNSATTVSAGACASPIVGTTVGAALTCTVTGLAAARPYDAQVVAFHGTLNVDAAFGRLSNVATGTTAAVMPPPPPSDADADTIFHDDFESGTLSAWQDNYEPSTKSVLTDAAFARSGQHYLAVNYPAGGDGGSLTHFFMPGYDSVYVRVWVRFPTNWSGGTKLIMLRGSRTDNQWSSFGIGGACPSGTDFFTTNLVARPLSTLPLRFYSYYVGMAREPDGTTCYGRYGDTDLPPAVYVPPLDVTTGGWHELEFFVRLNTPGQADGRQQMWLDGVLRGEWSGLVFRTSDILKLNAVTIESSMNETPSSPQNQTLYFDDVLVLHHRP